MEKHEKTMYKWWLINVYQRVCNGIPSGYVKIAIENGDLVRGFSQLQNGDFPQLR